MKKLFFIILAGFICWSQPLSRTIPQETSSAQTLDHQVKSFLTEQRDQWHDLNIPEADGRTLYNLIIKNNYRAALEIGTSTGRSSIWLAWALSKTGGKLITIEIDPQRHARALENFARAGLSGFIDARLADAHNLVPEIKGPFDFVFCDADKDWYKNYFIALYPKLKVGGCFAAHNVSDSPWSMSGTAEFYRYVKSFKNMETTVSSSGSGMSISYKKSAD